MPAAQYTVATVKTRTTGMAPSRAPTNSGTKAAACNAAQKTVQRRYLPSRRTIRGESSCRTAPANSGTVDTRPLASWLLLAAKTKAGRYVSPIPTITLVAVPSAVEREDPCAADSTQAHFLQCSRKEDEIKGGRGFSKLSL